MSVTTAALAARSSQWLRAAAVAVLYSMAFLALDRVSTFHSVQGTEISPWEPAMPLLLAAVIEFGAPFAPIAILLPWLAEIINRHADPLGPTALAALACIGGIYAAMGLFLRRVLRRDPVDSIAGFALLLAILAVGALLGSSLFSLALMRIGALTRDALLRALVTDWIGNVSGVVVVLPLYLLARTRDGLRLAQLRPHAGELLLQLLTLALVFGLTFDWLATTNMQLFYLFFVPVIWMALRFGAGITAVAMVLLQAGIVGVLATRTAAQPLVAIQLLMLVLASTGLFMAIVATHNSRLAGLVATKDAELAKINRSAGIMELNAAIAHELNNPLAAVSHYLSAANLLLERPAPDLQQVGGTVHKALGEARRAVEVLGKLRAFYRGGTLHRERLAPRRLIDDNLAVLQSRLRQAGIRCVVHCGADLPPIEADATQLAVVLHNLLANACDAVQAMDPARRAVAIRVDCTGDEVRFRVEDQGGGIPAELRAQLFWPLSSGKPAGMGLGLAISRSLLEANGGRIWLERSDGSGSCIAFSVPAWSDRAAEHGT